MRLHALKITAIAAMFAWAPAAFAQKAMSPNELDAVSAGEAPQLLVATRQNVDALSSGNRISADTVTSGNVNFSENSLSGFNGIGNVVVNTGNNNSIQGTLSVTIVTAPMQ